ncbi:hypothetical protein ACFQE3_01015 [Deinococcus aquaticus]
MRGDAGVAGGAQDLVAVAGAGVRDGVFAAAAADDQHAHQRSPPERAARRCQ